METEINSATTNGTMRWLKQQLAMIATAKRNLFVIESAVAASLLNEACLLENAAWFTLFCDSCCCGCCCCALCKWRLKSVLISCGSEEEGVFAGGGGLASCLLCANHINNAYVCLGSVSPFCVC